MISTSGATAPEKYSEARIIFKDFETSNWTWDPVTKAYYWHRFYSHQPDLNFDSRHVQQAVLDVVDFWFDMGVDAFRLDAIPYLYERSGTNCENLPETHAFLKQIRAHVDAKYKNRMLLAEANQWPDDSIAYFGEGDECHMAFHFPVMPRMFMANRMEDRYPIIEIMRQTPPIPGIASGPCSFEITTNSRWRWSPMKSVTICTACMPRTGKCVSIWEYGGGWRLSSATTGGRLN